MNESEFRPAYKFAVAAARLAQFQKRALAQGNETGQGQTVLMFPTSFVDRRDEDSCPAVVRSPIEGDEGISVVELPEPHRKHIDGSAARREAHRSAIMSNPSSYSEGIAAGCAEPRQQVPISLLIVSL